MIETEIETIDWLAPWALIDAATANQLAHALHRELTSGHVLFGRPARAIARQYDQDGALFIVDHPKQLAVVHLTYSSEPRPGWPRVRTFESVATFAEQCMEPDHRHCYELDGPSSA